MKTLKVAYWKHISAKSRQMHRGETLTGFNINLNWLCLVAKNRYCPTHNRLQVPCNTMFYMAIAEKHINISCVIFHTLAQCQCFVESIISLLIAYCLPGIAPKLSLSLQHNNAFKEILWYVLVILEKHWMCIQYIIIFWAH